MKIKNFIRIFAVSLLVVFVALLASCSGYSRISKIEMKNTEAISIEAGDFSFEGIKVVVIYANGEKQEIDLTEDMIPEVEKLNFYKMGEHDVKVVYENRYSTILKINVVRHSFDDIYALEGYTCTYDGNPHSIELNYELPEGAKIEYPYGNTFTNAGEYEVVGVISKAGYNAKTLTATLKIEKADYDLSEVKFEDMTYEYDGEIKKIEATGVPKEIEVKYDIYNEDETVRLNNALNAGVYTVVARFSSKDGNYNEMENKKAKLTITKAKYDMSKVKLSDYTKDYDGQQYQASIDRDSVLPSGVTVSYKYYNSEGVQVQSNVNAGEYKVVAEFKSNNANYEAIEPMEAKLTVNKKLIVLDGVVTLNSKTVNFNRETHRIDIEGNLPNGVEVTYENNDQIAAGEYKVIAKFNTTNDNEELDINELDAYLIINKVREEPEVFDENTGIAREIKADDLIFTVDPETDERTITINGLDEEEYSIIDMTFTKYGSSDEKEVDLKDFVDGESYNYKITFAFNNEIENASILLSPASGIFDCNIVFNEEYELVGENEIVYDGKPHTFTLNKDLIPGASSTITIYNEDNTTILDEAVNVGTYNIVCNITKESYRSVTINKILTITKSTYDMSGVKIGDMTIENVVTNGISKEYNKDGVTLSLTNLPEGVTYTLIMKDYFDDIVVDNIATNKGDYKISVTFTGDENNYNPIDSIEFTLIIVNRIIIFDPNVIVFEDHTVILENNYFYNNPHYLVYVKDNGEDCYSSLISEDVLVTYEYYKENYPQITYPYIGAFGTYIVTAKFTANNPNEELQTSEISIKVLVDPKYKS